MNLLAGIIFYGTLSFASGFPEAPSAVDSGLPANTDIYNYSLTDTESLDSCATWLAILESDSNSTEEDYRSLIQALSRIQPGDSRAAATQKNLLATAFTAFNELLSANDTAAFDSSLDFSVFELPLDSAETDTIDAAQLLLKDTLALGNLPQPYRSATLPPIPVVLNHDVQDAINFFLSRGKKVMQRWLDRSATVVPELMPHIREEGFPEEIIYLCMIESGLNYNAYSRAKAAGPWQFIAGTGKRYKLKINKWYDERRDPELSTHASMAYLRDLYGMFGDWYLVMAAYNCGENRIARLRKVYGDDFWAMKKLPRQTRNYVPTYIAARMIAENPEMYGFWKPNPVPPQPTEIVMITDCVSLKDLADCAGVDYEIFKMMNPALLKATTPPGKDSVRVRLPAGALASGFWDRFASIPISKRQNLFASHVVKKGETLGGIAKKYGVTVEEIVNNPDNNVGKRHLIHIGQVLTIGGVLASDVKGKGKNSDGEIVKESKAKVTEVASKPTPKDGEVGKIEITVKTIAEPVKAVEQPIVQKSAATKESLVASLDATVPPQDNRNSSNSYVTANAVTHRVSAGETMFSIARRYGLKVEELASANGRRIEDILQSGQVLNISSTSQKVTQEASLDSDGNEHLVVSGDTLWYLARRYGVTVDALRRANGLHARSKLRPGQRLSIPTRN